MNQQQAKKLTESELKRSTKKLLFEISRAINSVRSRVASEEYFSTYTVYDCEEEYLKLLCSHLNKEGYLTKVIYTDSKKEYTVIEISWKVVYV